MKISSYNINDVGYHYIGLRVIAAMASDTRRLDQATTISQSIQKYVRDRSLRLMLPEPKGTYETVGEKVCRELVHMGFCRSEGRAYLLTPTGEHAAALLDQKRFPELRKTMIAAHLGTYDNLRHFLDRHMELGGILRPIIERGVHLAEVDQNEILRFVLAGDATRPPASGAYNVDDVNKIKSAEEFLHTIIIRHLFPGSPMKSALFRSLCDRLSSLRLLNLKRTSHKGREFLKSYATSTRTAPPEAWYIPVTATTSTGDVYQLFVPEPVMSSPEMQNRLRRAIEQSMEILPSEAGYYDLPEIRDTVCESLRLSEAAFDEGLNVLLQSRAPPFSAGFQYERISARRKPLARSGTSTQLFNLLRKT